jgi:NAD-reducing hydrogenase small subunit
MSKATLATVWLDGCSGCHMSFLDIDERLLDLAQLADLVYSPLVDPKQFPEHVDITLVEGAVSSDEDERKIRKVRAHSGILVSLGDCAVNANVPSMRNVIPVDALTKSIYQHEGLLHPQVPRVALPTLLPHVRPVHAVVKVDVYVPGCPPHADTIFYTLTELLAGRHPDLSKLTHFGA